MTDKEKFLLESCDKLHKIKEYNKAIQKVENEVCDLLLVAESLGEAECKLLTDISKDYLLTLRQHLEEYINKC